MGVGSKLLSDIFIILGVKIALAGVFIGFNAI
jgi:hypothetical protein